MGRGFEGVLLLSVVLYAFAYEMGVEGDGNHK